MCRTDTATFGDPSGRIRGVTSLPDHEALLHVRAKVIQRSAGRSAVAAAAYRAAARLSDERTGRIHDYNRKQHVVSSWIVAPAGAPVWALNRAEIWNRVEASERRKDAALAREVEISIPRDLPADLWRPLIDEIVAPYVAAGAIADIAIHSPKAADSGEQPHAHVMLTLRKIDGETPSGFALTRNARLTSIFESGGTRGGKPGEALKAERVRIAEVINRHLAEVESSRRVDARSYIDRNIRRQPEPQIGEQRMHAVRRRRKHDRRTQLVHALREARRTEIDLSRVEGQMATEKPGFKRLAGHRKGSSTDYKVGLLLSRYPGLDTAPHAANLYMIDVQRPDRTRILMRDGGWLEVFGRRVRTWGPGDAAPALACDIASLVGADGGVEHLQRTAAIGRSADARPIVLGEGAAVALADRWRERGYTDISESPDGVWVHLGPESRLRDTGDHVSVFGQISDESVRALVEKASDEWHGQLESHGPDEFRERLWLEAQRQSVEVIGYKPSESLRQRWEAEQAKIAAESDVLASVRRVAGDADILLSAARGDVESLSRLDPELRAFVSRHLDDEQRAHLARQSAVDVAPELARFRSYGRSEIDRDPNAAATVHRPAEPARARDHRKDLT